MSETLSFVETIRQRYRGGRDRLFILHGNTGDLFPFRHPDGKESLFTLPDFLFHAIPVLPDKNKIWLHFSLGFELRSIRDEITRGFSRIEMLMGNNPSSIAITNQPTSFFKLVESLCERREVTQNTQADQTDQSNQPKTKVLPLRIVVTDAHLVIPEAQTVFMRPDDRELLVLLKRFASDPRYDDTDTMIILVTDALSGIHRELHECAVTIAVPRPSEEEISRHFENAVLKRKDAVKVEGDAGRIFRLASGLSRRQVENIVSEAAVSKSAINAPVIMLRRRELVDREFGNLLEFMDPEWTLDDVGGLKEAVAELKELAEALKRGDRDIPAGVILVGQNGIGKTFLAKALCGSAGFSGLMLKAFQDSPLGSSERNWEKAVAGIISAKPVMVFWDEADAQLGQRSGPNVHEVSKKIFSAQMQFMGDPRWRGSIIHILATCRSDKLAPDVKRPGRCERVIPLFPLVSEDDILHMLQVQVKRLTQKDGYQFSPDAVEVEPVAFKGKTGAQVERMLRRARRLAKGGLITRSHLGEMIDSERELKAEPMAYELQRLLGMLEAVETENQDLIPEDYRNQIESMYGGVEGLRRRVRELTLLVDGV